jgi:hypothetical protein
MHTLRRSFVAVLGAVIYLCSPSPSPAAAQAVKPVCDLVTEQDAITVLGSLKQKNTIMGEDQCNFTTQGLALMINRLRDQEPEMIQMMMDLPKNRARPGDVVKEEPGIGQRAVSEKSGGSVNLFVHSGTTVWTINLSHVYNKDLTDHIPKLKQLAQKLIGAK